MLLSLCCQILGCLTNPSCDYAEELLVMFCKHFSQLYGEDQIIYNVHCLIHLANDVRTFGPLQRFSSFPFENHLQSIKRLIRNSRYPLEQVIRRLYEKSQVAKKAKKLTKVVKKRHRNGPLPIGFPQCKQYEAIEDGNYYVSIHQGDSGVLVDEDIFVVQGVFLPVPLGLCSSTYIAVVHQLGDHLFHFRKADISAKLVLLPFGNGFVTFPMVHTL